MSTVHRRPSLVSVVSFSMLFASSLSGQTASSGAHISGPLGFSSASPPAPSQTRRPDSFGTLNTAVLSIPVDGCTNIDSTTTWTYDGTTLGRYRTDAGLSPWFHCPINIPSGANIDQVAFEVYDNDAGSEIGTWIIVNDGSINGNPSQYTAIAQTSGQPGWTYIFNTLNVTVDNFNNSYTLEVAIASNGGKHIFRRALVYYHLQVSAAPGSPTFNDVPLSDPAFQYIEALNASGITAGCGGGNFCPNNPLTRRQMAVFLAKALGLYWQY